MFLIDVKGLYRKNPWVLKQKAHRSGLYYVLAFVPDDASNQFFIMIQHQANTYVQEELMRLGRPGDYSMSGISWKQAVNHENAWDVLPS